MPDRIFRDEILASPRYWQLSSDTARMLFFHLGLRADDLGIFRAANYTIRQECFGADHKPGAEALSKLLAELADADLIRMWQEDGADYGFIPRWKQRLRIVKSKFPLPPPQIRDKTIIELISKMSDGRQASVGHMSAEVKRREEKRRDTKTTTPPRPAKDQTTTKGTRMIPDAKCPDDWRDWAVEAYGISPQRAVTLFIEFRDYWADIPGQRGLKVRWLGTFKNRLRALADKAAI